MCTRLCIHLQIASTCAFKANIDFVTNRILMSPSPAFIVIITTIAHELNFWLIDHKSGL